MRPYYNADFNVMGLNAFVIIAFSFIKLCFAADEVGCPAPISPHHGQAFLTISGRTVRYSCNRGYEMRGTESSRCFSNRWYPPPPICQRKSPGVSEALKATPPPITRRPLFHWNDVPDDRTDGYYRRPVYSGYNRKTGHVYSATRLEEEEITRSQARNSKKSANQWPSPYNRRQPLTSKSQSPVLPSQALYNRPPENTKGYTTEEDLRQIYSVYQYPRQQVGVASSKNMPVIMTLNKSDVTRLNALSPEMRERYLRELHDIRVNELEEEARAREFLRRHGYHQTSRPPFMRQPVTDAEDAVSTYDYSCHSRSKDGRTATIYAPDIPNAQLRRYGSRKNSRYPNNNYLVAEYACSSNYVLLDNRFSELYCSKGRWIGTAPICMRM